MEGGRERGIKGESDVGKSGRARGREEDFGSVWRSDMEVRNSKRIGVTAERRCGARKWSSFLYIFLISWLLYISK